MRNTFWIIFGIAGLILGFFSGYYFVALKRQFEAEKKLSSNLSSQALRRIQIGSLETARLSSPMTTANAINEIQFNIKRSEALIKQLISSGSQNQVKLKNALETYKKEVNRLESAYPMDSDSIEKEAIQRLDVVISELRKYSNLKNDLIKISDRISIDSDFNTLKALKKEIEQVLKQLPSTKP